MTDDLDKTRPHATPENTPLPGGGSWAWDAALPGWVENPAYSPAPTPAPAAPESATPAHLE